VVFVAQRLGISVPEVWSLVAEHQAILNAGQDATDLAQRGAPCTKKEPCIPEAALRERNLAELIRQRRPRMHGETRPA
jgi:hypothetical protein